jgi:Spy/CpxP family protein refolding chaperone
MNVKLLLPALLLAAPLAFAQGGPGMSPPMHDHMMMHHEGGEHHGDMDFGHDHFMWWKSPEIAARIGLTADQQKKMEDIFIQSRVQLIDLHATIEKEQLLPEPLMNANPIDQPKAIAQIDKVADTRAALEKTNAKMLLSIRGVLTPDQWTKLQAGRHEHEMHHGEGGPEGMHHGAPMGPGGPHWNHQPSGQPKPAAPSTPPAQ